MLRMSAIGRPTTDIELRTSKNGVEFVGFSLAVNGGFGEKSFTEYVECYLNSDAARRFVNAKVKKGSLIWISGNFRLRAFTRSNNQQDKTVTVQISDWGYVPSGAKPSENNHLAPSSSASEDKKANDNFKVYEEESLDGGDDLPF